jgi:hypothetical protein
MCANACWQGRLNTKFNGRDESHVLVEQPAPIAQQGATCDSAAANMCDSAAASMTVNGATKLRGRTFIVPLMLYHRQLRPRALGHAWSRYIPADNQGHNNTVRM